MRLLNLIQDVVLVHKWWRKHPEKYIHPFTHKDLTIKFFSHGIEFIRGADSNTSSESFSVLMLSDNNSRSVQRNNTIEATDGSISSFYRMNSPNPDEVDLYIQTQVGVTDTIDIPQYNDNEEEIEFALSTLTASSNIITMWSILLTMDTSISTMYTHRLSYDDIDTCNELLQEVKKWINSNNRNTSST